MWYLSQAFSGAAANWSTIEQEAYAVFWAILALEHVLRGHQFQVQTDHRNLVYIYKSQVPKLLRWKLRMQEFDFTIQHVPGKDNVIADYLSRCCALHMVSELRQVHNSVIGHLGVQRTIDLLQLKGSEWDNM